MAAQTTVKENEEGKPKQYGYMRVDIAELTFIESEMHTLLNGSLNDVREATFWARIGFVANDDSDKRRLEQYWPPDVACPIDKPVTTCRKTANWPPPPTPKEDDENLNVETTPQETYQSEPRKLRTITLTIPKPTKREDYAKMVAAGKNDASKGGAKKGKSKTKSKKKKGKKGDGASKLTEVKRDPLTAENVISKPEPSDALRRTKPFELNATVMTHLANCALAVDVFCGSARDEEVDTLVGTGFVDTFFHKLHRSWPESVECTVNIKGENCGTCSPTVTITVAPSPSLSQYMRNSRLLHFTVHGISHVPTNWIYKVNTDLLDSADEKSKKDKKKPSSDKAESSKWWLQPNYSVSLALNGSQLSFYNGKVNEGQRNMISEQHNIPAEDDEVPTLPDNLYEKIKEINVVKFGKANFGIIFLPADVVMSATSPIAKDRFSIAYEIVYNEGGVYPDGFDFKRLVNTSLCEKFTSNSFTSQVEVFKGNFFLHDLLASGATDCSFDTSSMQLSSCKILHYACEDGQWFDSSQHKDVVSDRELLATIKKRRAQRKLDLNTLDPEYYEYDSEGERNDIEMENSKCTSKYVQFFQPYENDQKAIPGISFNIFTQKPVVRAASNSIVSSNPIVKEDEMPRSNITESSVSTKKRLLSGFKQEDREMAEFAELLKKVGKYVMSNIDAEDDNNDVKDGESSTKSLMASNAHRDDANTTAAKSSDTIKLNLEALESKLEYNVLRDKLKILVLRVLKEKMSKMKNNNIDNQVTLSSALNDIKRSIELQLEANILGAQVLPKWNKVFVSLEDRLHRARVGAWESEVLGEINRATVLHYRVISISKEINNSILLAQAWHNCAAFYCRTGDFSNALSCAENSIKTQKNFRPPHVLKGCLKMEQGRYDEALEALLCGEKILHEESVQTYFDGYHDVKEEIEDLEVCRSLQAVVYRHIQDDDRCILSIQRIGNGAYDSTHEAESKLDSLEWGIEAPDPSVVVDVFQIAATYLVEYHCGRAANLALRLADIEERFPSPADIDAYKAVHGNRRTRYKKKKSMLQNRQDDQRFSLWATQLILREVKKWPEHMLQKQREMEERGEDEETIELLYDEEEHFVMTKLQRLHNDLLCGRCISLKTSNKSESTESKESRNANAYSAIQELLQNIIDRAQKDKVHDVVVQAHLVLAKAHENMGNYDAGITAMEEALRISGGGSGLFEMDPAALYMFGHIAEHRGQWMVSRSAYQSLVKEDDTLQTAQRKIGEMNIRLSRYDDASVALSAAVTLDPTDATSLFLLTKSYLKLKDYNASKAVYKQASSCEENCFDLSLKNEVGQEMKSILFTE